MTEIFHYPDDLDALVEAQWPASVPRDPLADARRAVLEAAYHASMLREENRPVRIRIALVRARDLEEAPFSVKGPVAMRLDRSRPFDVDELRRIAHAAPFETAVVGVEPDQSGELRIWGVISTGAQWLAPSWGGRDPEEDGLLATIVHVRGPARIAVYAAQMFVAGLEGGRLVTVRTDVFRSRWLPALFAEMRAELVERHRHGRASDWPVLDESLVRLISQLMVRRALHLMREAHHGATVLFVEPDQSEHLLRTLLRPKYRFADGPAKSRYRALLATITDTIAQRHGGRRVRIDAEDFAGSAEDLMQAEAAMFELSRTLASLSAVDGAVVLSKRFEILAFGTEIVGVPARGESVEDPPARIQRALDVEGEQTVDDDEENVGTRHRAAYRFVLAHPRGLAIVVSQDGSVRFVTCQRGRVVYFEQHIAG